MVPGRVRVLGDGLRDPPLERGAVVVRAEALAFGGFAAPAPAHAAGTCGGSISQIP